MSGLNAENTIPAILFSSNERITYQLSNANKPQNNDMILFSLILQALIYVVSISISEETKNGTIFLMLS